MFDFLKRKKKPDRGMTIGNYHSGDAGIEAMKDEFFEYFNQGERAGMLMGDEYYLKAYNVAKEWTKKENTNRSYGCLAAAAFKLGVSNMELLTNAPDDVYVGLEAYGLRIVGTRAIE